MSISGYTKLFNSILASTVWREPNHVRIVWITLLAMADRHGVAEGSVPGLSDFARVSIEDCRDALQRLSDPDRDSRSQEHDGRRIIAVDGGWQLLNHAKYREKLSSDERREYLRQKQREYRARKSASTIVTNVSDTRTLYTHTEAEAEATTEARAPRVRRGYADPHGQRTDVNAVASIFAGQGRIVSVPEAWATRARREYGLTAEDVDAFAMWASVVVQREGFEDGGKRLPWLDGMLARWRASRVEPKGVSASTWLDAEAAKVPETTPEHRAAMLAELRPRKGATS